MITITEQEIAATVSMLGPAVDRYCWLQARLRNSNVAIDPEFQRRFNRYYRVRGDENWRSTYYAVMESAKTTTPVFSAVLSELARQTGRVEASFASKLVATIDPNQPVVDTHVLHWFGLRLPVSTPTEKAPNRQLKIPQPRPSGGLQFRLRRSRWKWSGEAEASNAGVQLAEE
jgi:hypothetical protein